MSPAQDLVKNAQYARLIIFDVLNLFGQLLYGHFTNFDVLVDFLAYRWCARSQRFFYLNFFDSRAIYTPAFAI